MKPLRLETRTYFDIGNAINPNCLKVMPLEPKRKLQKFAVGTLQNLQYWECKKGEMILETKTENQAKEISRVVLSGNAQKYSMFFAAGQSIRGVTKKGKEFFKLDTSHTEIIKSLHVAGQFLWSAGDYILNCYESVENKILDKYFYICEDKINDLVIASVSGQMVQNAILACQDKTLRVLSDDKLLYAHKFDSACTALSLAEEQTHRYCPILGYGLRNGGIGCIELTRDEPVILWSLEGTQTNGSSVAVVKTCNFDGETTHGFIVARDDGSIEIYSYDHKSPYPILRFETKVSESITGIDIGFISSPGKQEVLLTTYSGKVMGLVEKSGASKQLAVVTDQVRANKDSKVTKTDQETQLENDIKQLEVLIQRETAELEKLASQPVKKGALPLPSAMMFEPFKVSYKMNLLPSEAAQILFVDSQLPIDSLLIQSMQSIDIIEVKDNVCKINTIRDKLNNNALLATLKVQGDDSQVSRIEVKLRTSEGQTGNLLVYVIPRGSTTCQVIDVELKPLSLHERVDALDSALISKLPLSRIGILGKFSLTDGHNWISQCLPDVPQNVKQEDDGTQTLYFRSSFIGTYIIIELKSGSIQVQSDNLSVITIIKDQLTQIANQKKLILDMDSHLDDASWQNNLALLHPLIQEQHMIAKKNQLIDGLKELQLQEDDMNFMSEDYKDILKNADTIRAQFKMQPRKLTYLWGIIADLYTDTAKIKGRHNVAGKMGTLKQLLNNYNYEQLIQFFMTSW